MLKKRLKNPIFLFYLLVGYVIVQFSWWLYLIFTLYEKTYSNLGELNHKTWMLVGEGSVFLIILLGGMYMIRRALKRERDINQLQENFLQSVSHELKTPLSSVGLFLETLKKHDLSQEKRDDIYDRALSEVKRLNYLISDILTARNIGSDNYFLNQETVQMDAYIHEKVRILRDTLMQNHQVNIETQPIVRSLDKEAFDSIIYNVIENACKYAPKKSVIDVKLFERKDQTILQVCDQGIGLDGASKEKVFGKFYRVENESTRKSKGTGLGLYITKFLVEKHEGKILLKDNSPQGLIVEIQL